MAELTVADRPPKRKKRGWFSIPRNRKDALWFLALALPNLILIGLFTYRPLIMNIRFSTLNWTLGSPSATEIGIDNYVRWFTSGDASIVLTTTAIFAVCTVGGSMILGLLVALALNLKVPGRTVARATVFAPYVLSGVGVGLVWLFIFDPVYGLLAWVLRTFGMTSPRWFNDPPLSLAMVIIVYIWKNLGYCAVVYLAGLQGMNSDLMEAAQIDGASSFKRFWYMTLPLLSPTTFFLTITTILSSLQAFDLIKIMTPTSTGTRVLIYEAYVQGFLAYQRAGYSAAISVILFVILLVLTVIQITVAERRVHYA
ncbi:MAG TPA: sugar ABC transporter permease [Propionibacteriaceae bacterium]|nr:sugar ABC transporter permease [Propionibacteriaceae bacterium]HPZ48775.1 sugar ABC transporter permease [Propionibacteriaceae bacterium]HQE30400.1 sugar ABC transporter permease [Propionibacteriaceae bacterium]